MNEHTNAFKSQLKALGIDSKSSLISNARKGIKKYSMPLNTVGLDSEFVNSIIENVNKGQAEGDKKSRGDLYVELNNKNQWEAKDTEGNLVATIPATTLGWKIQPGAKEKRILAKKEKQKTQGKTSQTYKSTALLFALIRLIVIVVSPPFDLGRYQTSNNS